MARCLKLLARMRVVQRPFIILPARDPDELEDIRARHYKLVPHACESCGELTMRMLCSDCEARAFGEDPFEVFAEDQSAE